jgi:hypothetical protein
MNWNNEPRFADENEDFIEYVYSFYGKEGLYPMGATIPQIVDAVGVLLTTEGWDFASDSVDREKVRDILIEKFELKFPRKS